jgi:hypothetical protein
MFNKIRNELMTQDEALLSGDVEVDETFLRGRMRNDERRRRVERGINPKNPHREKSQIVYAAVERNGRVRATTIPNSRAGTLVTTASEYVLPGSLIYTDEWQPYMRLDKIGYTHTVGSTTRRGSTSMATFTRRPWTGSSDS